MTAEVSASLNGVGCLCLGVRPTIILAHPCGVLCSRGVVSKRLSSLRFGLCLLAARRKCINVPIQDKFCGWIQGPKYCEQAKNKWFAVTDSSKSFPENDGLLRPLNTDETVASYGPT